MVDTAKDLQEAMDILEGRSAKLPTIAHLRAMQVHHEDSLILAAMKIARVHDEIFDLP